MAKRSKPKTPPDICPICGAEVPRTAKSCPECGADHDTGWSEEAYASGLDLPGDDDFDYDEFTKKEFGTKPEIKPRHLHWFWWLVGLLMVLGLLVWNISKFL